MRKKHVLIACGLPAVCVAAWSFLGAGDPLDGVPPEAQVILQCSRLTEPWQRLGGRQGIQDLLVSAGVKQTLPEFEGMAGRARPASMAIRNASTRSRGQ